MSSEKFLIFNSNFPYLQILLIFVSPYFSFFFLLKHKNILSDLATNFNQPSFTASKKVVDITSYKFTQKKFNTINVSSYFSNAIEKLWKTEVFFVPKTFLRLFIYMNQGTMLKFTSLISQTPISSTENRHPVAFCSIMIKNTLKK